MPQFQPLDLSSVYRNAEAIRAMQSNTISDQLQREYLRNVQMPNAQAANTRAQAQEVRASQTHASEQSVTALRLLNAAAAETAANPQAYERWVPQLRQAGIPVDQLGPMDAASAKQLFEQTSQALKAYQQGGTQANTVQSTHILDNGNIGIVRRDGTIQDTGQKAKPQIFYGDVGGVPTVTRANGAQTTSTPVSTLPQEANARTQLAAAQAEGTASVIPADARESARTKLPRARAAFRRLTRVSDAVEDLADNMILKGGPFQSATLSVTKEGQELDQAVAQLIPEITSLTRVPGVGSQSDLEQRLANLSMPSSGNYPEVNRRAIQELEAFLGDLEAVYGNISSGGSAPQASPTNDSQQIGRFSVEVVP